MLDHEASIETESAIEKLFESIQDESCTYSCWLPERYMVLYHTTHQGKWPTSRSRTLLWTIRPKYDTLSSTSRRNSSPYRTKLSLPVLASEKVYSVVPGAINQRAIVSLASPAVDCETKV